MRGVKKIRVLLVDDERSVLQGLQMRLALEADIGVVGQVEDGMAVEKAASELDPDVIVMDYGLPGQNGLEAIAALEASGLDCSVVMLSIHDCPALRRAAREAGAAAFVAKHEPSESLVAAIRAAARHEEDAL